MIDIEKLKDIIRGYCAACDTESEEYNEGFQACGMMILKEIEKLSKEKSDNKDLKEEKAKQLAYNLIGEDQNPQPLIEALVDMAEWQYQKDRLKFSELKTKLWQEGFDAGAEAKEKQMMEEGIQIDHVEIDSSRVDGKCILSGNFYRYNNGDKVKLIVIKED